VDAANFAPSDLLRRRRPDRAEAMKAMHRAAEHDAWFRRKVETALAEANDPDTKWVSNKQAAHESAAWWRRVLAGVEGQRCIPRGSARSNREQKRQCAGRETPNPDSPVDACRADGSRAPPPRTRGALSF
jgi:hypothetical protein